MNEPAEPPPNPIPARWPPWAVAVGAGATGWILTMILGDRQEAWDSPLYYRLAYPLFALTAAVLGYLRPGHPWRWALGVAVGQALVAFVRNPTANLLPLGLIALLIYSAPLILVAMLGSRLRGWRDGA